MDDFTDDLENWMGKLSPMIRTIPIINLAIPGNNNLILIIIFRSLNLIL